MLPMPEMISVYLQALDIINAALLNVGILLTQGNGRQGGRFLRRRTAGIWPCYLMHPCDMSLQLTSMQRLVSLCLGLLL